VVEDDLTALACQLIDCRVAWRLQRTCGDDACADRIAAQIVELEQSLETVRLKLYPLIGEDGT
jgi:hypothetical protein